MNLDKKILACGVYRRKFEFWDAQPFISTINQPRRKNNYQDLSLFIKLDIRAAKRRKLFELQR